MPERRSKLEMPEVAEVVEAPGVVVVAVAAEVVPCGCWGAAGVCLGCCCC